MDRRPGPDALQVRNADCRVVWFMNVARPSPAPRERPTRMSIVRQMARHGLASFVGVGRGIRLLPLDTMCRTVGLRYGWLTAFFNATPAPLMRGIGRLRAERRAAAAERLRDGLGALNIDYRSSLGEFPGAMLPIVSTYARGGGPFAGDTTRFKQRRIG